MGRNKWYSEFETRRQLSLEDENHTWIDDDPDFDVEEILPVFMRLGASRSCGPRAEFMEQHFGVLRRSALMSTECSQEANILLEECSFGDQTRQRTSKGPLTPRKLFESLQRPRFRIDRTPDAGIGTRPGAVGLEAAVEATESGVLEAETDEQEPNAERRVIYIADPNRWSMLALIATASFSQTGPLRNVLYRHFRREAYVGVTTTTSGLTMFELAFHLPFWALRELGDGDTPENSRDVSFLDPNGRKSMAMVQSSYSCSVSGVDIWRWVAYFLIDTQHDEFTEDRESAERHYTEIQNSGLVPTPSPCGNAEFFDPGPEPRWFFLKTLEVRLKMIHDEWMQIVQWLERSVVQNEQVRHPSHFRLLSVPTNH